MQRVVQAAKLEGICCEVNDMRCTYLLFCTRPHHVCRKCHFFTGYFVVVTVLGPFEPVHYNCRHGKQFLCFVEVNEFVSGVSKYPPPPCISYALVQAAVGVGSVLIWYLI